MKYVCKSCAKEWDYRVENCIFCGDQISEVNMSSYIVEEVTQVFVPSEDHSIIPYYVVLLRDNDGSYLFHKTFQCYEIGKTIDIKDKSEERYSVGIVGTGVTAKGLVEVIARAGNRVILKSRNEKSLKEAIESVLRSLGKSLSPEESYKLLDNVIPTTEYESLSQSDFVIESVIEDIEVKRQVFKDLDCICCPQTILASNTSSLSISKIAKDLNHPERAVGLHFFNPIPRMQLVEIVRGEKTSEAVIKKCHALINTINKVPIEVADTPGFVVNRLLFSMINEACHMLERGVAKIEDIDTAMKLGANYPMGPFELADMIGLDLCLEIIENLGFGPDGKKFEVNGKLKECVQRGCYGRKSHRGFYKY